MYLEVYHVCIRDTNLVVVYKVLHAYFPDEKHRGTVRPWFGAPGWRHRQIWWCKSQLLVVLHRINDNKKRTVKGERMKDSCPWGSIIISIRELYADFVSPPHRAHLEEDPHFTIIVSARYLSPIYSVPTP